MIRAHGRRAECCLNWNVYDISVNCEFEIKCMQKMNVIARISYLGRSVITLKLRKEYLNMVTYNTSVLLWTKNCIG